MGCACSAANEEAHLLTVKAEHFLAEYGELRYVGVAAHQDDRVFAFADQGQAAARQMEEPSQQRALRIRRASDSDQTVRIAMQQSAGALVGGLRS